MNAIGYSRLSDEGTIETQNDAITYYCERNALNLVKIFSDDGVSGGTFDRPGWIELETFLKGKHNISYMIVTNTDRFSRTDMLDAMLKMRQIETRCNIKILTIHDSLDLDINDPTVRLIRMMQSFTNEQERLKTIERTKRWIHRRTSLGYHSNMAPFGYVNAKAPDGGSIILIDEEKAPVVRVIFSEFIKGTGIEEIRRVVKSMGFTNSGSSAIQRILGNPLYAGMIKVKAFEAHQEKIVDARHAPIISKHDYYLAQEKLGKKTVATQNREEVPLRGVLRCFCGELVTAGNSRSKSGKYYWYYLCNNHRNNLPAIKLHAQFNEMLDTLSLAPDEAKLITDRIIKAFGEQLARRGDEIAAATKNLKSVQKKIENTEEKYLLQPDINPVTYNKVINTLRAEEMKLHKQLTELNSDQHKYFERLQQILPALGNLKEAFEKLPLHKQHQFINVVFDRKLYYANDSYRTPFIHPIFKHKELVLKEKGLLSIEQPSVKFGDIPVRTRDGSPIEHDQNLQALADVFAA